MADEAEASCHGNIPGLQIYYCTWICVPDASSIQSLDSVAKQSTAEEIKDA